VAGPDLSGPVLSRAFRGECPDSAGGLFAVPAGGGSSPAGSSPACPSLAVAGPILARPDWTGAGFVGPGFSASGGLGWELSGRPGWDSGGSAAAVSAGGLELPTARVTGGAAVACPAGGGEFVAGPSADPDPRPKKTTHSPHRAIRQTRRSPLRHARQSARRTRPRVGSGPRSPPPVGSGRDDAASPERTPARDRRFSGIRVRGVMPRSTLHTKSATPNQRHCQIRGAEPSPKVVASRVHRPKLIGPNLRMARTPANPHHQRSTCPSFLEFRSPPQGRLPHRLPQPPSSLQAGSRPQTCVASSPWGGNCGSTAFPGGERPAGPKLPVSPQIRLGGADDGSTLPKDTSGNRSRFRSVPQVPETGPQPSLPRCHTGWDWHARHVCLSSNSISAHCTRRANCSSVGSPTAA